MSTIAVYDTTLRDGTQSEGISLSVEDKLKVALLLDKLGVAYIEGGWPGSNPKDAAFFQRIKDMDLQNAKVAAFGMTCRVGGDPESDPNIKALLDAETPVVTVVGKTSMLHVTEVIRTTPAENLRIIRESLAYLKAQGKEIIYDAEHFFDGYKLDADYAIETLRAAVAGGAEMLVLCETNGGAMFWEVEQITGAVAAALPGVALGIHTHNDGDQGVANTLAAVRQGAVHVQGTINGYGERCGNADLCSILSNLEIKMGLKTLPAGKLKKLSHTSRTIAEICNMAPNTHQPFVGKSAFAHKGGIHVAAMRRNIESYQHIDPTLIGNEMRFLVSDLAGRGNILSEAEKMGMDLSSDKARQVLDEIKVLENEGFVFEGADASVDLMLQRTDESYIPPFELINFTTMVSQLEGNGSINEAMVKVRIGDEVYHTAAEGNGPVNALDEALRKALVPVYPDVENFHLVDYKVRVLDGENGTEAMTRVLIDTRNGSRRWSTVGAGTNIINASWRALADSVEYGLSLAKEEAK
ncbi:citramalate synthase [Chloroflexota bacterium]